MCLMKAEWHTHTSTIVLTLETILRFMLSCFSVETFDPERIFQQECMIHCYATKTSAHNDECNLYYSSQAQNIVTIEFSARFNYTLLLY